MTELGNDELTVIIGEKLEQIAHSANTAIGVFGAVQIFGLYVNSDNSVFSLEAEVEDCSPSGQINSLKSIARTNRLPILFNPVLNHRTEGSRIFSCRDA